MGKPLIISEEEKQAVRVVSQNELTTFCVFVNNKYYPAWIHEKIAEALEKVERGETKRLIICVPPRNGKSELGSISFPAWYLGRHPEHEVIVSSYSAELAQDFGYKTRNLVNSQEYQEIFNARLRDDSQSKAKWLTEEGGGYTAVGVGGAITGRGANLFVIDDPLKNREEAESRLIRDKVWSWYTSTAYTRLEKDAAVVLILTRWNKDDLAGRLLEAEKNGGEHWDILKFPAIAIEDEEFRKKGEALWPEKYDLKALLNIKNTIGSYDWSALYQQEPMSSETQEFKQGWFKHKTLEEVQKLSTRNFLTIDTAVSQRDAADFTGMVVNLVDKENKWNFISYKLKINPKELIDNIFSLQAKYNLEVIGVEKTVYLQTIKPFLDDEMRKRGKFLNIKPLEHRQIQKETRIRGLIPRYESGSIFHIKGQCSELEEDLLDFPKGVHDDVADAAAYQAQIAIKPDTEDYIQKPYQPTSEFEDIGELNRKLYPNNDSPFPQETVDDNYQQKPWEGFE